MADADIQISAGSGTKVDTRTVGSSADEHRQVIVIGDPSIAASVLPLVAKGEQGTLALPMQDLKDSGRTAVTFRSSIGGAGTTTEGLLSLTPNRQFVDGTAGTSQAVTAGKRLRLSSLIVSVRNNTAAANWARFALRVNPSGAALVNSPIVAMIEVGTSAAVAGNTAYATIPLNSIELSGSNQLALTQIAGAASNALLGATLLGHEY